LASEFENINDDLLVKYLLGEASAWEEQAVKQWAEADTVNQKYLDHLKMIWEGSRELAAKSTVDENKAWQRFQRRVQPIEEKQPDPPAKYRFSWMRVAAAVALVLSIGIITWLIIGNGVRNSGSNKEMEILAQETVENDTLPDGSMVTLNKKSFLNYNGKSGKRREVRLKGEAFFNVVPDKQKPFVIHANDVDVTVIGTSFYVKAGNGVTEVVVETGIVQVKKGGRIIDLRPGEKTTITDQDTTLSQTTVTDKLHNYYRSRQFVCDDTPLWKLVDVLNEAYGAEIVIANERLKNLPLTVTFNNESLDQVLQVISLTLNIKVAHDGERIILQ
jgi:transmembrane sensor